MIKKEYLLLLKKREIKYDLSSLAYDFTNCGLTEVINPPQKLLIAIFTCAVTALAAFTTGPKNIFNKIVRN